MGLWRSNMIASINGAIEINGVSQQLSSSADRKVFHLIRAYSDAVVIGKNNAITEGYTSIPPLPMYLAHLRPSGGSPTLVVLARTLDGITDTPLTTSTGPVILVTDPSQKQIALKISEQFPRAPEVVFMNSIASDLSGLREELEKFGITNAVCEGGPTILQKLLAAGYIDEICISIAPCVAPSNHGGFLGEHGSYPPAEITLLSILEDQGTLLLRYQVTK